MASSSLHNILKFLHESEALKRQLRHSWLSDGRQESVAEHTWRMALMAMVLSSEIDSKIDLSRVMEMVIVHDLGEVYLGDYQVYGNGNPAPENKHELEQEALKNLLKLLPSFSSEKIYSLWLEFEEKKTIEAKFAVALDKLEVIIQHNEAELSTYLEGEGEFNLTYADDKVNFDKVMIEFREILREETKTKISAQNYNRF